VLSADLVVTVVQKGAPGADDGVGSAERYDITHGNMFNEPTCQLSKEYALRHAVGFEQEVASVMWAWALQHAVSDAARHSCFAPHSTDALP
jgi:hypothetical protein